MTPLAHRIVKELTIPVKDRIFEDKGGLLFRMSDIHCFDVTEVFDVLDDLGCRWHSAMIDDSGRYKEGAPLDDVSSFLPAPKTWIEYRFEPSAHDSTGGRLGMLLEDLGNGLMVATFCVQQNDNGRMGVVDFIVLPLKGEYFGKIRVRAECALSQAEQMTYSLRIYAALAVINSPKIIGAKQNMPHRGLQRALLARQKTIGKFPLHAWTEIKLKVTPPMDISGQEPGEAHLTGRKALHFCRAHLRVRLGRLEIVRAHWRGDASIGIKQSRYKVTA